MISIKDQVINNLALPNPITEDINKKKIKHLFDNQAINLYGNIYIYMYVSE